MTRNDGLEALGAPPSAAFVRFLDDYFGAPMILARQEEDPAVLDALRGRERDVAADMILASIDRLPSAFGPAAARLGDERAVPKLRAVAAGNADPYLALHAAKVLYDWVGFEGYLEHLDRTLPHLGSFGKTSASLWVSGLPRADAVRILFRLLADPDSFVRSCAFDALRWYFFDEFFLTVDRARALHYVGKEVARDEALLRARLEELRREVETWPAPMHGERRS